MQHDVLVIGGGFAGLSAATYLARARRRVAVIDTGVPRNRFAHASHGFLGQDGARPLDILARGREQLLAYPTTEVIGAEAVDAVVIDQGFAVTLATGAVLTARLLVLAFGLTDTLPAIPGLRERWGRTVLHCPYCHGIEFSDRPLGVLYRVPMSVHQAQLIAEWGPTTLFLNGAQIDEESRKALAARGVAIEPAPVRALDGRGDAMSAIMLDDGRAVPMEALYTAPESSLASPLAERLGVEIDVTAMGPMIRTDAVRMTSVPGVFAAGDIARQPHSVAWAVGDGVTAGTAAHRSLVFG